MIKKFFLNNSTDKSIFLNPELIKLMTPRQILLFIAWFIISTLLIAVPFFSNKVNVKVDQVAAYTLLSPMEIELVTAADLLATEKLKTERLKQIEDIYDIDPAINEKVKNKLQLFFKKINRLKQLKDTDAERPKIVNELDYNLTPRSRKILFDTDPNILNVIETLIVQTLNIVMNEGVLDKNALEVKVKINNEVSKMNLDVRYKEVITEILFQAVENNKTLNVVATNFKKSQVLASIAPVKTFFVKNQPIFYKGDTITPEHIEILKKLGLYGPLFNLWQILLYGLINFIGLVMLWAYLLKYKKYILRNTRLLFLLMICSVALLFAARLLVNIDPWYFPVIMVTLIYTIVLADQQFSFALLLYSCVFATIIFRQDFFIFFIYMFNILFGIYFSRRINQRNDITAAAFYTAIGTLIVMLLFQLATSKFILNIFVFSSLKLIAVAMASAVMVIGLLPYIEHYFNVVTTIRLLELSNPNMPLLKRLLIEAPGTYHHSIMVANLAEAAIETIGGNSLLARVAAYYHDIGKIQRPYFFVENQIGLENPHDKISISLSLLIILSHVKEGILLAQKYKLPQIIIDIIAEHHGTSLISYFYRDYLENRNKEKPEQVLNEESFRYPGPRPQTREAAVIMIADSCEAAIRSLEKTTQSKVQSLIQKIIKDKFSTGQLDDSDLTFKDLQKIEEAFMQRLAGLFHSRISYTEAEIKK